MDQDKYEFWTIASDICDEFKGKGKRLITEDHDNNDIIDLISKEIAKSALIAVLSKEYVDKAEEYIRIYGKN